MRIELTDKCNLNCSYCHASPNKKQEIIEDSTLENIINKAGTGSRPTLSGGEPFLVFDKMIYALHLIESKQDADYNKTKIQTNATLITQEHCDILKEYNVVFRVSLDGPTKEIHNIHRQQFDETISGIKLLVKNNFKVETTYVISPSNYKCIKEHVEFCESLGIKFIQFRKVLYDDNLTDEMISHSISEIKRLSDLNYSILFGFKGCREEDYTPHRYKGCVGRLCFLSNGDVNPCGNIKYTIGNINEDSLYELKQHKIWDHFITYDGCAMNTWEEDKEEFLKKIKE